RAVVVGVAGRGGGAIGAEIPAAAPALVGVNGTAEKGHAPEPQQSDPEDLLHGVSACILPGHDGLATRPGSTKPEKRLATHVPATTSPARRESRPSGGACALRFTCGVAPAGGWECSFRRSGARDALSLSRTARWHPRPARALRGRGHTTPSPAFPPRA